MQDIPYEAIQETRDRAWSLRLVDRLILPDISEDERDQIISTLERVDDPRVVMPLVSIMESHDHSDDIREAASYVFLWGGREPHPERRLAYWQSGDTVLQRYALFNMRLENLAILEEVAADPQHPLHRDAIAHLDFSLENPKHQALQFAALKHPDPAVRKAATNALFIPEPVSAEIPLIEATNDEDFEVASNAIGNLAYYLSQRVYLHLRDLSVSHSDERIRERAAHCSAEIRFVFAQWACDGERGNHIRQWLAPIWELLAFTEDELTDEPVSTSSARLRPPPLPVSASEVITLLDNPDTSVTIIFDLFWHQDWNLIAETDRAKLASYFTSHADPVVRDGCSRVLSQWDNHDALICLIEDEDFFVRKSAMYWLSQTSPRHDIAGRIWDYFNNIPAYSVHAYETIKTYSVHADRSEAIGHLFAVADNAEQGEDSRCRAIHILGDWGAVDELTQLMKHLSEPPALTWALHIALLNEAAEHHLALPDLTSLLSVDNVDLQVALALVGEW